MSELHKINPKKAGIPPKILKKVKKTCGPQLEKIFNNCIETCDFPSNLKLAKITPVFKRDHPTKPQNYYSVSKLHMVSKIFERLLYKQIDSYFKKIENIIPFSFPV